MTRLCCYIPDQTDITTRCHHLAEYQIWFGYDPGPEDYTECCAKHIGQMLDDNVRFEILKIGG